MKTQTIIFSILTITLLQSCGGKGNKQTDTGNSSPAQTNSEQTTQAPPADDGKGGIVSFKVNDTLVRTNKTTGGDNDENLGMYTEASKTMSFSLMGDVPERPHRGWLHFSIKDFKFEPATYTMSKDNNASFSRYETINAGGETIFSANSSAVNAGTEMVITFISITKGGEFPGDYSASGTFSVKLYDKIYEMTRKSKQEINITEGKFENIRVVGGPKE